MTLEQLPVTPEVITWARERAGFSLEEATNYFRNIQSWELGGSFPTYSQLEKLADKFKLPVAVFFFPEPPETPAISDSFRTLPVVQFEYMPREIRQLLRKAKALQLNLAELNQGKNSVDRLIFRDLNFPIDVNIDEMAQKVREYLDISLEIQCSWKTNEQALDSWRRILNGVGISIFKDAFKVNEYSGFCLYDDVFPLIYVNNSTSKTRQIFTLFHELAHLIFKTSGIDTREDAFILDLVDDAQRIEIICNRFAANFLVPDDVFEVAFRGRPATEVTAESLALRFHVSREVIFRKFFDRHLIDEERYLRAAREWAAQAAGGTGGNWYHTKIAYLGRDYIGLAFSQFYKNRITESQLAEYLDTKPRNLNTLEEYFARGSAVTCPPVV